MRLFATVAALLGAVGTVIAQNADFHALTRPGMNEEVPAGKTYTVTWNVAEKYEGEQVIIGLLGGDSGSSLRSLGTIGLADGDAGKFSWAVDSSLGAEKTYGLTIKLARDTRVFQYSTPFSISGRRVKALTTTSVKASATTTEEEEITSTSSSQEPKRTSTKEETSTTKEESTSTSKSTSTSTSTSNSTSTSSSSSSSSSTSTTATSSSSENISMTTTFATITSSSSQLLSTGSSTSTSTESSTATSEPSTGSPGSISTGAWIGIGAAGIAGSAILLGMISMIFKIRRRQDDDRYQDIDRQ